MKEEGIGRELLLLCNGLCLRTTLQGSIPWLCIGDFKYATFLSQFLMNALEFPSFHDSATIVSSVQVERRFMQWIGGIEGITWDF